VHVVSPLLSPLLRKLADDEQITWSEKRFAAADLQDAYLVFAATDDRKVQEKVARAAAAAGLPVNVADSPADCTFHVPAVVRRGKLTLAVSTGGESPAVAAMVRRQLARQYGEEYRLLLELIALLRRRILDHADTDGQSAADRKILFKNLLHDDIVSWIRDGQWDLVTSHVRAVLGPDGACDLSSLEQPK